MVEKELYKEKEYVQLDLESGEDHRIFCPHCKTLVKADNLDLEKTLAKCHACDTVFNFQHQVLPPLEFRDPGPEMLIPEGLEVLKLSSELDVRVNWYRATSRGGFSFILLFTLLWNIILLPFVGVAIATGEYQILLFTSLHILVGLGFLYHLGAIFLNTTSVNVTKRYVEVNTGPLPSVFRKNRKIESRDISQLYVSKYVSSRTNGNPNYAYALYAVLKGNKKKIPLIKGMNRETQVYLEKEIENFLGIRNRPVDGEDKE